MGCIIVCDDCTVCDDYFILAVGPGDGHVMLMPSGGAPDDAMGELMRGLRLSVFPFIRRTSISILIHRPRRLIIPPLRPSWSRLRYRA